MILLSFVLRCTLKSCFFSQIVHAVLVVEVLGFLRVPLWPVVALGSVFCCGYAALWMQYFLNKEIRGCYGLKDQLRYPQMLKSC